jgi:hypothetical protein
MLHVKRDKAQQQNHEDGREAVARGSIAQKHFQKRQSRHSIILLHFGPTTVHTQTHYQSVFFCSVHVR